MSPSDSKEREATRGRSSSRRRNSVQGVLRPPTEAETSRLLNADSNEGMITHVTMVQFLREAQAEIDMLKKAIHDLKMGHEKIIREQASIYEQRLKALTAKQEEDKVQNDKNGG